LVKNYRDLRNTNFRTLEDQLNMAGCNSVSRTQGLFVPDPYTVQKRAVLTAEIPQDPFVPFLFESEVAAGESRIFRVASSLSSCSAAVFTDVGNIGG
jgi:hypothetical protein